MSAANGTDAQAEDGVPGGEPEGRPLEQALRLRRRAQLVSGLRGLNRPVRPAAGRASGARTPASSPLARSAAPDPASSTDTAADEHCDLCGTSVPGDHRHLLNLVERRIECSCESCWALRSGDPEYRPTGARTMWLADLVMPDDVWGGFQIPIGLAFFMESSVTGCVVALYPSPAGATESELHFSTWNRLVELNPILGELEADVEGLIVNRLAEPPVYAIAPIDRCYALTGTIKASWEGISGGAGVTDAVDGFFEGLRADAVAG
jgi:hypothetical protein